MNGLILPVAGRAAAPARSKLTLPRPRGETGSAFAHLVAMPSAAASAGREPRPTRISAAGAPPAEPPEGDRPPQDREKPEHTELTGAGGPLPPLVLALQAAVAPQPAAVAEQAEAAVPQQPPAARTPEQAQMSVAVAASSPPPLSPAHAARPLARATQDEPVSKALASPPDNAAAQPAPLRPVAAADAAAPRVTVLDVQGAPPDAAEAPGRPAAPRPQAISAEPGAAAREPETAGKDAPPAVQAAQPRAETAAPPPPAARQLAEAVAPLFTPAAARPAARPEPAPGPVVRSLKVALMPRELGQLRVTLRLAGEALDLTVETETPAALRQLEQDRPLINRLLQDAGVAADVGRIELRLGNFDAAARSSEPRGAVADSFAADSSAQGSGRGNDGRPPSESETPGGRSGPAAHDQAQDEPRRRPHRGIYL